MDDAQVPKRRYKVTCQVGTIGKYHIAFLVAKINPKHTREEVFLLNKKYCLLTVSLTFFRDSHTSHSIRNPCKNQRQKELRPWHETGIARATLKYFQYISSNSSAV